MNTQVIHTAGKIVGLVQRCSRCGLLLQDNREKLGVFRRWRPAWWGGNVIVEPRQMMSTKDVANCKISKLRVMWMGLLDHLPVWFAPFVKKGK